MRCPVCKGHKQTEIDLQADGFTEGIVECKICGTVWAVNHGLSEIVKDAPSASKETITAGWPEPGVPPDPPSTEARTPVDMMPGSFCSGPALHVRMGFQVTQGLKVILSYPDNLGC